MIRVGPTSSIRASLGVVVAPPALREPPRGPARPRTTRPARRALLCAVAALAALGAPAAPAAAHDQLLAADPAPDTTVEAAPTALTLEFSAPLLDLSATVTLTGPDGPVATEPPVVADRTVTVAVTGPVPDGAYAVAWRVVSSDGHPIEGGHGFLVDAPDVVPAPTAATEAAPSASPAPPSTTAPSVPATGPTTSVATTPASPEEDDRSGAAVGPVVGTILAVAALGALVWWVLRRRRS